MFAVKNVHLWRWGAEATALLSSAHQLGQDSQAACLPSQRGPAVIPQQVPAGSSWTQAEFGVTWGAF